MLVCNGELLAISVKETHAISLVNSFWGVVNRLVWTELENSLPEVLILIN